MSTSRTARRRRRSLGGTLTRCSRAPRFHCGTQCLASSLACPAPSRPRHTVDACGSCLVTRCPHLLSESVRTPTTPCVRSSLNLPSAAPRRPSPSLSPHGSAATQRPRCRRCRQEARGCSHAPRRPVRPCWHQLASRRLPRAFRRRPPEFPPLLAGCRWCWVRCCRRRRARPPRPSGPSRSPDLDQISMFSIRSRRTELKFVRRQRNAALTSTHDRMGGEAWGGETRGEKRREGIV